MPYNQKYEYIIGKIEKAEPFKPGGKLLRVIINGREFRAFDVAYLQKVGVEHEWSYYTKPNEWNGQTQMQDYLTDLTPKQSRRQYAKTFVPNLSRAPRTKHTIDEVYEAVMELRDLILSAPADDDVKVVDEQDSFAERI